MSDRMQTIEIPLDQLECIAVETGALKPSETQLDLGGRGSLALHKEATETLRAVLLEPPND